MHINKDAHTSAIMSMLDYKNHLEKCGVETGNIAFIRIGRSVYTLLDYKNANGDWAYALKPCYRTDWVTHTSAGNYPDLLPSAYKRSRRTLFVDPSGKAWYITGWNFSEQALWLHPAYPGIEDYGTPYRRIQMHTA